MTHREMSIKRGDLEPEVSSIPPQEKSTTTSSTEPASTEENSTPTSDTRTSLQDNSPRRVRYGEN